MSFRDVLKLFELIPENIFYTWFAIFISIQYEPVWLKNQKNTNGVDIIHLGTDPIYWLERDYLLSKLSEERSEAIGRYNEFVCAGIGVDPEYDFETGSQAGILGDDDFVKEILGAVEISKSRENTLALPELINMVCHKYNVSLQDLISSTKEKSISHVRGLLALLVRESTEFTLVELGEIIMRNTSGLSQLANRSAKRSRNNLNFQQEINEIRQMLTS